MANYTAKERAEYNTYRDQACKRLGISKNEYNALRRLQEALRRWDERRCNGECTDNEYDTAVEAICDRVKRFGLAWYHQSDPRGAALYVDSTRIDRDRYHNAVCIY